MTYISRLAASLAVVALIGPLACSEALDDGTLETSVDTAETATTEAALELAYPGEDGVLESADLTTPWGVVPITYERFGEEMVFEGDMILDESLLHRDEHGETRTVQQALAANPDRLWPGGVIPYTIDASLSSPQRVTDAIAHWESKTPLRFVQRTNQPDYVVFKDGTGCSATVGKIGGAQSVRLKSTCSTGNAIHEIGHAIGLWHTQARADRDNHVTIHWGNIKTGKEDNFQTYITRGRTGIDIGTYEVGSIMHYSSYSFSANGQPTITRKDGSTFSANRSSLTGGDISSVGDLYDPDGDGALVGADNCPNTSNAGQADADGDGIGDACDTSSGTTTTEPEPTPTPEPTDTDGDGVADTADNCPTVSNAGQADSDGDGTGDVCDSDRDGDGVSNSVDNCPDNPDPDQTDLDGDGRGAPCDPDDGTTTTTEPEPTSPTDTDGDGVVDGSDNCPTVSNAGQDDADADGMGDACDPDDDNDGVSDAQDNCPLLANADQADSDGDGIGDVCDATPLPEETTTGNNGNGNGGGNGGDNGVRRGHEVRGPDRNAHTSSFGDETGEIDEEYATYAAYNEAGESMEPMSNTGGGDAPAGGCSSTGNSATPSAALLLLAFAFFGMRRRARARVRARI